MINKVPTHWPIIQSQQTQLAAGPRTLKNDSRGFTPFSSEEHTRPGTITVFLMSFVQRKPSPRLRSEFLGALTS